MNTHTRDYDELARRAENGGLTPKPGTTRRGTAAADEARRLLLEATGTATIEDATRVAVGRPALGTKGTSPVVRARVPQTLRDQLQRIAASQHRRESEVIRDALTAYVGTHSKA